MAHNHLKVIVKGSLYASQVSRGGNITCGEQLSSKVRKDLLTFH